jgi:hypothetical protein
MKEKGELELIISMKVLMNLIQNIIILKVAKSLNFREN